MLICSPLSAEASSRQSIRSADVLVLPKKWIHILHCRSLFGVAMGSLASYSMRWTNIRPRLSAPCCRRPPRISCCSGLRTASSCCPTSSPTPTGMQQRISGGELSSAHRLRWIGCACRSPVATRTRSWPMARRSSTTPSVATDPCQLRECAAGCRTSPACSTWTSA